LSRGTDKVRQEGGSVLIVGVGALGTAAALELATTATRRLRRIRVVDGDHVESSNLHRQMLHEIEDLGRSKAVVASEKIGRLGGPAVEARALRLTAENARELLDGMDVAIDATDDVATKFLLNDVCLEGSIPLVHAGVVGFGGQVLTIVPGEGPCLRCLFPEPPTEAETATCRDAGILGPVAGFIGVLEARAALDLLGGRAEPRLVRFDGKSLSLRASHPRRSSACAVCAPPIREIA
jgi:adenylyltransferase/sulfurtransferase